MRIFIIPYRDREEHKTFFLNYISNVIDGDYTLYFIHQCDSRPFNRGAMKNLGYLITQQLHPGNNTLIFNDVDIMPYTKDVFAYDTIPGVICHNYGYKSCLSASFVITSHDFGTIHGFPNLWEWGLEDNIIQERALAKGLVIQRDRFHPVGSRKVLQLFDGIHRWISNSPPTTTKQLHAIDGYSSIKNISYRVEGNMIHIDHFDVPIPPQRNLKRMIVG